MGALQLDYGPLDILYEMGSGCFKTFDPRVKVVSQAWTRKVSVAELIFQLCRMFMVCGLGTLAAKRSGGHTIAGI